MAGIRQILGGSTGSTGPPVGTNFLVLHQANSPPEAAEEDAIVPLPFACAISRLWAETGSGGSQGARDDLVAGETVTLTVRKNQIDTALVVVLDDTNFEDQDLTNVITFAADDDFSIKVVAVNGTDAIRFGFTIKSTDDKRSCFIFGTDNASPTAASGRRLSWGGRDLWRSNDLSQRCRWGADSTIRRWRVSTRTGAVGPTGADGYNLWIRKNGSQEATTAIQLRGSTQAASVGSLAIDQALDNQFDIELDAVGSPNAVKFNFSVEIESDVPGEWFMITTNSSNIASGDNWMTIGGSSVVTSIANAWRAFRGVADAMLIKNFYAWATDAPGAGNAWLVGVQRDRRNRGTAVGEGPPEPQDPSTLSLPVHVSEAAPPGFGNLGSMFVNAHEGIAVLVDIAKGTPTTSEINTFMTVVDTRFLDEVTNDDEGRSYAELLSADAPSAFEVELPESFEPHDPSRAGVLRVRAEYVP